MILCCGEALVDMIPSPTASGREGFVPHSGGAVFNTAVALGRLGVRTGMLTAISSDLFGRQLLADLHASHVDSAHVIHCDRPTTLAFVQLRDGNATYSFFDENSAGRMLREDELPPLSEEVSTLYFGGISLACEPGAQAYAALAAREHGRCAIMLDPNIRPGFIGDVAGYRARLGQMIAHADCVKVSDEDLGWIFPGPEALADKVARLRAAGPSVVILTRGGEGASAWLADGREVAVPSRRVAIADTVGAGDTFNAGVLAHLSEQGVFTRRGLAELDAETLKGALAFGAEVAAVTVSRVGANPPWRNELAAAPSPQP